MAIKRYIPIHTIDGAASHRSPPGLRQDMGDTFRAYGLPMCEDKPARHTLLESVVDIEDTGTGYVMRVDVAGVAEDRVKLAVCEDSLIIKGEKEHDSAYQEGGFYLAEHSYSSFERCLTLPGGIDKEHIQARFEGGLLVIRLSRDNAAASVSRGIPIRNTAEKVAGG